MTAAPSGKAKEVEVEVILRQKGTGPIQDKSFLTDIRNTEGDEEYTVLSDGTLSWQNQGEDIHYKGNADPASVPMEIDVSYTMDGVISTPQALAGTGMSEKVQGNCSMLVGMCLFVALNYLGQRFFVFKKE